MKLFTDKVVSREELDAYRRFSRWARNGWSPQTTPRRPGTTPKVGVA
jgi:hypothetical protein